MSDKSQTPPKELTQARLKELVNYDPETGIFTWISPQAACMKPGDLAGSWHPRGYLRIKVCGKRYMAHRLAFLWMLGSYPPEQTQVDHINGVCSDNRWENLRHSTHSENQHNYGGPQRTNTCGFLGVYWHKRVRKWCAKITLNRRLYHLGYFNTAEEASFAYLAAKDNLHPTHMRLREQADER